MKPRSEDIFEQFLSENAVPFERVQEQASPRPDYSLNIGSTSIMVEVKELTADGPVPGSRIVGDDIRRCINGAKPQIQFGAGQGLPSILLIYNAKDPVFQMFATEEHDFVAAMYGEYTALVDKATRERSDWFQGRNQQLQEAKNTSFSAVGHLCDRHGTRTVTLFENVFAKVKVPCDELPSCFAVRRCELSEADFGAASPPSPPPAS